MEATTYPLAKVRSTLRKIARKSLLLQGECRGLSIPSKSNPISDEIQQQVKRIAADTQQLYDDLFTVGCDGEDVLMERGDLVDAFDRSYMATLKKWVRVARSLRPILLKIDRLSTSKLSKSIREAKATINPCYMMDGEMLKLSEAAYEEMKAGRVFPMTDHSELSDVE